MSCRHNPVSCTTVYKNVVRAVPYWIHFKAIPTLPFVRVARKPGHPLVTGNWHTGTTYLVQHYTVLLPPNRAVSITTAHDTFL
jgi:hypothetical protein